MKTQKSVKNKKKIKRKEQLDKSLKVLFKSSFIVFIGLFLSKVLMYTYRIIIARYYGPEIYGLFSLVLSVIPLFITIASFGFVDGLLRFVPLLRERKKINEMRYLFRKTLRFYLISGIIASIILIGLSDFISINIFHNSGLSIFLKIMSFSILAVMLSSIFLTVLRGFEKIGWYSFIFNIFQNLVRVSVLIILILIGLNSGANAVVWSYISGSILTLFIAYIVCKNKINKIFGSYEKKDYSRISKEFFQYSWPLLFFATISIIFHWIDTLSLGYYKSAVEVGFYNAAVPIAMLIMIVPQLFMQLFFPLITRQYSTKNKTLIKQLSKQVNKWIFMAILPIFILLFFFSGTALNILFGSQYIIAQTCLKFLLIGTFVSALFTISTNLISMLGKSKLILFNISISSIINLILNSILVPMPVLFSLDNSNGLIGASLATVLSIIFLNTLLIIQTKKYLSFIPLKRKIGSIILISIIPTFILFYLIEKVTINIFSIIILTSLFILLYLSFIIFSHSLDKEDLMILKSVTKKLFKDLSLVKKSIKKQFNI